MPGIQAATPVQLSTVAGKNYRLVTIANNAAVSDAIVNPNTARESGRGLGVISPAAWTDANIGFEVSIDGITWFKAYYEDERIIIGNVQTSEARFLVAPPEAWVILSAPYVRLVSLNTSTGANVNQGGARQLWVVLGS